MFIRVRILIEVENESHEHPREPFDVKRKFKVHHWYKKDQPDEKYKFDTKLILINTNQIVSIIPIQYYHSEDSWGPFHDGSLIIDSTGHEYVSIVPELDARLMELETQQFDFFTFDEK